LRKGAIIIKHMNLYRNILKRAWEITWKFKYLWFFGLFVALLGNGGEMEIISRSFDINNSEGFFSGFGDIFTSTGIFSRGVFGNIGNLAVHDPFNLFMVILLILIMALLTIFVIWLMVVSQAAIVNNTACIVADKGHNLKDGLLAGIKKFWPVFGLNVLVKFIIMFIFFLISLPFLVSYSHSSVFSATLVFIISYLIFIPAAIIMSFIIKYSIGYSVIKNYNFIEALKSGWNLFLRNWLVSLEMAFILFFINFFAGLLLIILLLILATPFLFFALLFIKTALIFNFWLLAIFAFVLFLAVIIVVGSALAVFQTSSWTGLYIELIGRGGISKLVRMFDKKVS
jgi:hypothetical protein